MRPILYGAPYSVYVQAARLALEEKDVGYDLVEVDVFAPGGVDPAHLDRQPFGKIPALRHGDFDLYETGAITRYVDEAFEGPALQPADAKGRARMTQAISILDAYAYPALVWGVYLESVGSPRRGLDRDEARLAPWLPKAAVCLRALADLMGPGPWLAGPRLSLADLHAAPMFALFLEAREAEGLMGPHPGLGDWWRRVSAQPAFGRVVR